MLFAATDGISARNNIGTATTTSKGANAPKNSGTEFVALAASGMIGLAVSETGRLTCRPLIEPPNPTSPRASRETTDAKSRFSKFKFNITQLGLWITEQPPKERTLVEQRQFIRVPPCVAEGQRWLNY